MSCSSFMAFRLGFLRSSERRSAGIAAAAAASGYRLQNIQDRRRGPAFQPNRCIGYEILQALSGCQQFLVVLAAFATVAIAVLWNFVAKRVRPQMGYLAQERDGGFRIAIFEFAIRRAHA